MIGLGIFCDNRNTFSPTHTQRSCTIQIIIEDTCMKYIHSDAALFLKKNNKFYVANFAILDVKFTSSSMEER